MYDILKVLRIQVVEKSTPGFAIACHSGIMSAGPAGNTSEYRHHRAEKVSPFSLMDSQAPL
jgi:hypothetical protein